MTTYTICEWVDMDALDMNQLLQFPEALDCVDFEALDTATPHYYLSLNPDQRAVEFLLKNPAMINWRGFSRNPAPAALRMLEKNIEEIYWVELCRGNSSPRAMALIMENSIRRLVFYGLSENPAPAAVRILMANKDSIFWPCICHNTAPEAIAYMAEHMSLVMRHKAVVLMNPAAMSLIMEIYKKQNNNFTIGDIVNLCANTNEDVLLFLKENYMETIQSLTYLCEILAANEAAIDIFFDTPAARAQFNSFGGKVNRGVFVPAHRFKNAAAATAEDEE